MPPCENESLSPGNKLSSKAARIGLAILFAAFLGTLLVPSTRDAHTLCMRLLLHLNGKTSVRGMRPGSEILIPRVEFSPAFTRELRTNSNRSATDYVRASATGDWDKLTPPPPLAWVSQPLLRWAAWKYAVVYGTRATNSESSEISEQRARTAVELVQLAQAAQPTNGALWLAEANLRFALHQEALALAALRVAADESDWRATDRHDFDEIATVLEQSGLSKLDAAIQATADGTVERAVIVQSRIRRDLWGLITSAVKAQNDQQVNELLQILVDLRKNQWLDDNIGNRFRSFSPGEDLVVAMADRLGRTRELKAAKNRTQSKLRRELVSDYVRQHVSPEIGYRFLGQQDVGSSMARGRLPDDWTELMMPKFWTSMMGAMSGLFASMLVLVLCVDILIRWLSKHGIQGAWPRQRLFWIMLIMGSVFSTLAISNCILSMGVGGGGWNPNDPAPALDPSLEVVLASFVSMLGSFAILPISWRFQNKPRRRQLTGWDPCAITIALYLAAVMGMAYTRADTVQRIVSSAFGK